MIPMDWTTQWFLWPALALIAGLLALAPLGRQVLQRQVVFIDLAVAHGAALVSKDKAVLTMRNRLARLGVSVTKVWPS